MEPEAFGTLPSRLPRVGGMATMPSRRASLLQALPLLLPQLDRLYLYLDQHEAVPEELAAMPGLVPLLPAPGERPLGGAGKFLALHHHPGPCLFFGLDDDILYHPGYVNLLAAALRRHGYKALVGLHGAVLEAPCASYIRDKWVANFAAAQEFDIVVDELGTGTVAMHSGVLHLDPREWQHTHMNDLMLALTAMRQGVPRLAIRRPAGLAEPIAEDQPDSLFRRAMRDDRVQTALLHAAVAHYPGRWCRLGREAG